METESRRDDSRDAVSRPATPPGGRGLFKQYKAEQGKTVRVGSFVGAGAIVAWGSWYLYQRLQIYEGDDVLNLLTTKGVPLLFAVVLGAMVWWIVFGKRSSGDFLIATEGEMKKVSWSTRREVIGATKVVILFTILLVVVLFGIDLVFQSFFRWIQVLKT